MKPIKNEYKIRHYIGEKRLDRTIIGIRTCEHTKICKESIYHKNCEFTRIRLSGAGDKWWCGFYGLE